MNFKIGIRLPNALNCRMFLQKCMGYNAPVKHSFELDRQSSITSSKIALKSTHFEFDSQTGLSTTNSLKNKEWFCIPELFAHILSMCDANCKQIPSENLSNMWPPKVVYNRPYEHQKPWKSGMILHSWAVRGCNRQMGSNAHRFCDIFSHVLIE